MAQGQFTRTYHLLRPLTNYAVPSNLIFADTETYPVKVPEARDTVRHHLRLWCAKAFRYERGRRTRVQVESGKDASQFWTFVHNRMDNKRPLWLFFHNVGFDLTVLDFWRLVLDGVFEFVQRESRVVDGAVVDDKVLWSGLAVLNDPPTIIKCRKAGTTQTLVIVDSYNYFRQSLESIGEEIGYRKGKMPPYTAPDAVWADYCLGDVKVLEHAVTSLLDFVRQNRLGRFAYTIASQAMNAYRARFMHDSQQIFIHGHEAANDLERDAYHGGAVHCWYIGRVCKSKQSYTHAGPRGKDIPCLPGPVYHLDVKSFYPSIMATNTFPYRLHHHTRQPKWDEFERAAAELGVIARVRLRCEPPGYPVTRDGKTYYAYGRFDTTLCGPELKRAYHAKELIAVHEMATYRMANLFDQFVSFFSERRDYFTKTKQPSFAFVCKCIMNSLYGKFGQKRFRWEDAPGITPPFPFGYFFDVIKDKPEVAVYRSMCWLPQMQQQAGEHADSFPAIAAYVTSYGRERILQLAAVAGIGNCLYSDTDSLHVNTHGYRELMSHGYIATNELGKLSMREEIHTADYRGIKDYTGNGKDTIAGIKKDAKRRKGGKYKQTQFQRLASILAGQELDSVAVSTVIVPRGLRIPLGTIHPSGRVDPVSLSEW